MRNSELIKSFIDGADSGKASNLVIKDNKLYNYATCIAFRLGNEIYLNADKYSATTSRNQNTIRRFSDNIKEMSEQELKDFVYDTYGATL